ncbi:hypothetical protein MMC22_000722 [Lobaria immixta]|nr:hypothetical protein [Lobaria immixta]
MAKSTRKKASSEPKAPAAKAKSGEDGPPLDTSIAEDTIAAPRPSRKRSGDFFDFTGEDDANRAPSSKAANAKPIKPKKKTKTAPVADDDTKPSKVDGHPVTTAKTQPGGDIVEVEPTKPSRRSKAKENKDETVGDSSLEPPPKSAEKATKSKKSKKTETEASAKPTSSKADAKKTKLPSSGEPKARAKKSKGVSDEGSNATTQKPKKAIDDGPKTASKKSKKTSNDEAAEIDDSLQSPESALDQEPLENLVETEDKGKKPVSKSSKPSKSSEPAKRTGRKSKQSQVPASDNKTENKLSEGDKAGKAPDAAESSKKPTKARKPKSVKDSTKAEGNAQLTATENVKDSNNVDSGPAKPEASKSKKRKTPVSAETDALHAQVLDPLSEHASAKKKQKKSQPSALEAPGSSLENILTSGQNTATQGLEAGSEVLHSKILDPLSEQASSSKKKPKKPKAGALEAAGSKLGDILASGLETAAQGVIAAKEYAAEVANGAQKSIMGDVTEVAEAVVDEKDKAEASAKKVSKAAPKKSRSKKVKEVDKAPAEPSSQAADVDVQPEDQAAAVEDEDEGDFGDDQTLALLKGFDSGDDDGVSDDEGFEQGGEVPKIPNVNTTAEKLKAANDEADEPGVVYVGRIPHGFYEHEMRAYFSQFGPISRLRLSRNRNTGKSKHYAFLEFESTAVAKIVASTMDNYLLFGHILKCKYAPPEQLHGDLWKGANKRFKAVPWSKIEGRKLEMPMGREGWGKRIETEKKRREEKSEAMKELGYEFEGNELKGIDEVPVREGKMDIEGDEAAGEEVVEEEKTVVVEGGHGDGTVVVSEIRTTKVKKGGKGKGKETSDGVAAPVAKRARKAKATIQDQAPSVLEKPEEILSEAHEEAAPVVEEAQEVTSTIQDQFAPAFQAINDTTSAFTEQATSVVETVKDTIQDTTAPLIEQAQDAISTVQEQTAPVVAKKAKRSREKIEGEATSVAKKAKATVEGEAGGAVKKGRKSKKATSS